MTTPSDIAQDTSDREILITRTIGAPRERVWEAFTDPKQLEQWWGPDGFTLTTESFDLREGGTWVFVMHGPDGRDYPNTILFTEITKPSRFGHVHGGDPDQKKFISTITLDDEGEKTKVTMKMVFFSPEERDRVVKEVGAIEGGNQTLGRLEQFLVGR